MKKLLPFLVVAIVVGALILGGCAQKTPTTTTIPSPSKTTTLLPSTTPALPPTTTKGTTTTPAAATTKQPKYGGILRVLDMNQGVAFGYPVKMGTQYGNKQAGPAIETLIRTGKDGMPIPWLATGWTLDTVGKTITLPLRKGVKFHDGTDFNAKAAKWNLDQFLAAKYTGTSNIASVDIIDDYTIRLNLTQWDSTILDAMTVMIGLEISPTAYETHGQQWCETHPVGTGPFEFVSYTPDVSTTYKKFNGYWQNGKPYLDGVEMRVILDMTTREYSFRKGEADVVVMLTQDQVNGLEKDGFVVDNIPSWKGTTFIAPDSKNTASPWSNLKVRQAAMYAIDNAGINEGVYSGKGIVSNQWTYQGHWAYNSSIVGYPYDATKAKQLLTEAGYPNGFKTTLSYVTDPTMDRIFTSVQSYFKKIGIDVTLNPMNAPKWASIALSGGTWDGIIYGTASTAASYLDAFNKSFGGKGSYYSQMLIPDDLAQVIQTAVSNPDFNTQQKSIQEAMKLLIDKYCVILPLPQSRPSAVSYPYVHDHGFYQIPNVNLWTPADAWLDK